MRAQAALADNPNGGGHTWANGAIMMYIPIIVLVYWFISVFVSVSRGRIFTKEFMSQFDSEMPEGITAGVGGAPDDGNGKFSDKLSYKDWVSFNVMQRIHKNFYESFVVVTAVAAIGGLVFPWVTVFVFPVWMLGRFCYGPAIMTGKIPIICINLCCLISLPFWAMYGGAVGFILQPLDQNHWEEDNRDKHR